MLRCWFILDRSIDAIVAFIVFIRYSKTRKLVTEHPCVVFRLCLSYDKFDSINDGETLIHQVLWRPLLRPLATQGAMEPR